MTTETRLGIMPMTADDWPRVAEIYRAGMETGNSTFETEVPSWDEWDGDHVAAPRLVAKRFGRVIAWAALSRVSSRSVYEGVAEISLYVDAAARGQGVGGELLEAMITASEDAGFWTLYAGIFPENATSLALFRRRDFRDYGVQVRIGKMGDTWRDVLQLERRSPRVGVD
ncbi:MAG: N-acetyltransferase family protein [Candidatus Dormibacteraeota bacterium]|nr:N-acetyltransferase family protein [Candidatus Dormibacteraeota bacterium]